MAQAQYFKEKNTLLTKGGTLSSLDRTMPEVYEQIQATLSIDPKETNVRALLALHAFEIKDYPSAVKNWSEILQISPEHPSRSSIENGIARAKQLMLGNEVNRPVDDLQNAERAEAKILVRVSLDESLADLVKPDNTVFVFARSESGPPMPLAAGKYRVADLPLEVVLSDDQAMSPAAKLSMVEKVNVLARISQSGQPVAEAGDLQGEQLNVDVFGGTSISIKIDRRL